MFYGTRNPAEAEGIGSEPLESISKLSVTKFLDPHLRSMNNKPDVPANPRPAVLIVDDTPANQRAFASVLEAEGYDLVVASSGQEALRLVLRQEFAVILLDVRMPGMDGIETATFLRCGRARHTPILFVSAYENTPVEVERGFLAGAIDYLFSPVDPDMLRRKVSALVHLYQQTAEYKRRSDALAQTVKSLQKKVEDLEETVAALKRRQDSPSVSG
jgi:CheY-like chemotaxis protein